MSLRPRVIPGKVLHVSFNNVIRVDFDLAFGVGVKRAVTIEGISAVPGAESPQMHCMVILLGGGRDVLVHTDDTGRDAGQVSRVYLDTQLKGAPPEGVMYRPYGFEQKYLEVGSYYAWLALQTPAFDVRLVRQLLNGVRNGVHERVK